MQSVATVGTRLVAWLTRRRAELRLALRVTIAALATYAIAHWLDLPQAYWAVITTVIVTQASVGGSLKAAIDRLIGTLGGVAYGVAIAWAIPHGDPLTLSLALAVAVAPLALLAAVRSSFRLAPVTAIIVLMGVTAAQVGLIGFAVERVIEIGLGCVVALAVSLAVLPARAHGLACAATGQALDRLGLLLQAHLDMLLGEGDRDNVGRLQDQARAALTRLETVVTEAAQERRSHLTDEPDAMPLLRTAQRIRHDVIMIGRAAIVALPDPIRARLHPGVRKVEAEMAAFLRATGEALGERKHSAPLDRVDAALADLASELAALRQEGLTRDLTAEAAARLFTLSFALEQLRQDCGDMAARTAEFARARAAAAA